jgi:hypothetical protein
MIRASSIGLTALLLATPAIATHDHPVRATKFLVSFVRAYAPCPLASATLTHNPPLTFAACPATPASTVLEWGPKGKGIAKGVVRLNAAKQATDIAIVYTLAGVVDAATGAGFNGNLIVSAIVRLTDHNCVTPGPCTVQDIPFPVGVPCGTAASPALPPGKCSVRTATSTTIPGGVAPGFEMNLELQQLQVFAAGELVFVAGLQLN